MEGAGGLRGAEGFGSKLIIVPGTKYELGRGCDW